jgi:hypothetical protein
LVVCCSTAVEVVVTGKERAGMGDIVVTAAVVMVIAEVTGTMEGTEAAEIDVPPSSFVER